MKNLINIKNAIKEIQNRNGWIYAKNDINTNDDAKVFFYIADLNQSPEEEREVRENFHQQGFFPYLSKEDIEDIVDNLDEQMDSPSIKNYLEAMRFFKENDAFIEID
jgi:hypothetical protein